jgi:GH43 family beta-xylosidase
MNRFEPLQTNDNNNLYSNPSKVNNIGDPFVLKASDGFYYMYCTSSENGYYCWKSADLVNWTDKKIAYIKTEHSWSVNCYWAPEVVEQNGVYYMYYTAKNKDDSLRIGVAVSSSPDGLFEEALDAPLFDFGYAAIDANVFIDDDNMKYLYFAKDCSENIVGEIRKSEIYGVRLNDDMLSIEGEPVQLTTPTQLWENGSTDTVWNEGPEMIKYNGTYYLTYSANYFASPTYSVGYATSDSPLGEFTKSKDNPILTAGTYENISGPGHHSFTYSPDGSELFMVYHTHTFPRVGGGNRQVNIDRVVFTENGEMYVNGPTISHQPIPSNSTLHNVALEAIINYKDETVPLLNDGIFTIHKKNKAYDWVREADNGNVVLNLTLGDKKHITSMLVYRGIDEENDFKSFDILINDHYILENIELSSDREQRAAMVDFKEIEAETIKITLYPKDGKNKISLSEIVVLGY